MNIGRILSTHHLMIKPHGKHRSGHKKSSVLVTGMDDPEEQARKLYWEQSRAVIEGFMQARSLKQLLEKPCSGQISDSVKKQRTSGHSDAEVCSVGYCTPCPNQTPGEVVHEPEA